MYKIIAKCPVCSKKLQAVKLRCTGCKTTIENEFNLTKFDYLNLEQLHFIETFIKCRGNIKEVEKELNISYPTVRAKLDEVIGALGYSQKEVKMKPDNKNILDALEKGEITADEAILKMNNKGGNYNE